MSINGPGAMETDFGRIRVGRSAVGLNLIVETEIGDDQYRRQVIKGLDGVEQFRAMVNGACDALVERFENSKK